MPYDPFFSTFSTDESIMEVMISDHALYDENHHLSSLPDSSGDIISDFYSPNVVEISVDFVSIHNIDYEKNLSNIE